MTRTPDLADPSGRGPPQSRLFPSIHRPIPFPAPVTGPGLDLDEDEHLALEDDEVEFISSVSPVGREAAAALTSVMVLSETLAPGAQISRRRADLPPCPERRP
jgi:hypothetical protein